MSIAFSLITAGAPGARAELELLDLPPADDTLAAPVVPDWRKLPTPPMVDWPAGAGQVALVRASALAELKPIRNQLLADEADREVIVLKGGSLDLASVAQALADPTILEARGRVFVLKRPLVILADALLRISGGAQLRLDSTRRAALVNAGRLNVDDSEILGWDGTTGQPSALRNDHAFRPFLLAVGASWTEIQDSVIADLGYDAPNAWGLTLAHRPATPTGPGAPGGRLIGNHIRGNYYGFYSHQAEDVVIADNVFRDSVVYGIDPHDRSRRLLIADNLVLGTQRSHGIVLSRDVVDSWIVGNRSIGNAGNGIILERQSTGNLLAHNVVAGNRGDGVSLLESPRNRLWHNLALGNGRNGLRVRNSWAVEVRRNRFAHNGNHGVELYARDLWDQPERDLERDPYRVRLDLVVVHNWFKGNRNSALSVRNPGEVDLSGLHPYPDSAMRPTEPLEFGGALRPLADAIEARLEAEGGVRIRGSTRRRPSTR